MILQGRVGVRERERDRQIETQTERERGDEVMQCWGFNPGDHMFLCLIF